jgi:asparaginyl-tRNA synthetase
MERIRIAQLLSNGQIGSEVKIAGWIRTKRESSSIVFLEINDGSCLKNVQAVVDNNSNASHNTASIHNGSAVELTGTLVESPAAGQNVEIQVGSITLFGDADPEKYPLQKKRHSFEFLREIAHLRPRTNTFGAVFRIRSSISFAIHKFFQEHGFINVHTPIITSNDCEGAGEMFRVTTHNPETEKEIKPEDDFFGKKASLTVSGQLEGELFAMAFDKIYTFGPTFRAENSHTSRHLSEFWMVEPEMAFTDIHGNQDTAEVFLKYLVKYVLENNYDDISFFDKFVHKGQINRLNDFVKQNFERIAYDEAVKIINESGEKFEYDLTWGNDIQTEHERYLTGVNPGKPVIIINYPRIIKPFYMYCNDDEKTVRAMDVLVSGIGEIIGGSEREWRLDVLLDRMKELSLPEEEYWWYIDTRRFGSAPHSGFGLGFERIVQFITGMENIRDVIPFPRTPNSLQF